MLSVVRGNSHMLKRETENHNKRWRGKKEKMHFCSFLLLWEKGGGGKAFFAAACCQQLQKEKKTFLKPTFLIRESVGLRKKNQACKSSLLLHITQVISNLIFLSSLSHTQPDAQKYYICLGKVKLYLKSIYSVFKKMDKVWTLGWAPRADNIGPLVGQSTYPFPILIYILVSCFPPPLPSSFPSTEYKQEEEGMWG